MNKPSNKALINSALLTAIGGAAIADPGAPPPACAQVDQLFCIRCTDIEQLPPEDVPPIFDNAYRIMLEFVNWTGEDAYGVHMALNLTGPPGADDPIVFDGSIDQNGRLFGPSSTPPPGNMTPIDNQFITTVGFPTSVTYRTTTAPIPGATASGTRNGAPYTFNGLLDPAFESPTLPEECVDGLLGMIPGSVANPQFNPTLIELPNPETIDDGPNVLDGFVIVIANFDPGDVVSFNWFLEDATGNSIGMIPSGGSGVSGDPYGFGIINICNTGAPPIPLLGPAGTGNTVLQAPDPPFAVNSQFDPPDTSDANVDSGLFWAENEVAGIDTFPINPIPSGKLGAGTWFGIEFGAGVTAIFADPEDNIYNAGSNITYPTDPGPGCRTILSADVNWDGVVDEMDLKIVLANMKLFIRQIPRANPNGRITFEPRADIDGDLRVTTGDVTNLIDQFGRRCIIRPVEISPSPSR